jgi:uncharacterized membrane protein YqaE (UPF0057 family)
LDGRGRGEEIGIHQKWGAEPVRTIFLIVLCLFFPFLAVLIHEGPTRRVLWAILFQIIGHLPGVIYGIYVVTSPPRTS